MIDACPECGAVLSKPEKPSRSYQQLKRVHALCQAAFMHWPEDHPFRPRNKDHLRYWLEMEAGHYQVVMQKSLRNADPEYIEDLLRGVLKSCEDNKLFIDIDGTLLTVKRVGSIAYDALSHADACRLFTELDAVLHLHGMDGATLLRETERAA